MQLTRRSMQLSRRAAAPRTRKTTSERSTAAARAPAATLANGDRAARAGLELMSGRAHAPSRRLRAGRAGLARAYDWSADGDIVAAAAAAPPERRRYRRFAFTEDAEAADRVVGVVGRALAADPVTLAYALPGKEQRYCEAALRAGLLTDSVGRDRRLWLSECGRAAAVAYRCSGGGEAASVSASLPLPPPLPLLAGAQRAALTAQALTSLKPGEPARACARAATALARVRGAYCAAVERSASAAAAAGGGGAADAPPSSVVVAYVSVLAVDPEAQGRGLGTRLLRGVLRDLLLPPSGAASSGAASASAAPASTRHAYVEASSERSAALYRRLGFRVIACVDADGAVRSGADAGEGDQGEWTAVAGLPRAPTLVLASELDGRLREWLVGEEDDERS